MFESWFRSIETMRHGHGLVIPHVWEALSWQKSHGWVQIASWTEADVDCAFCLTSARRSWHKVGYLPCIDSLLGLNLSEGILIWENDRKTAVRAVKVVEGSVETGQVWLRHKAFRLVWDFVSYFPFNLFDDTKRLELKCSEFGFVRWQFNVIGCIHDPGPKWQNQV